MSECDDLKKDLRLTELLVISPCLSPVKQSDIILEKTNLSSPLRRALNLKSDIPFLDLNNRILLTNPLYFHGLKMFVLIKCTCTCNST